VELVERGGKSSRNPKSEATSTIFDKNLAVLQPDWYAFSGMSAREALIQEILKQPEPVLRELQRYLTILVEHQQSGAKATPTPSVEAWPAGYFETTAGAFAGEPLERPPQLPFEKREEW